MSIYNIEGISIILHLYVVDESKYIRVLDVKCVVGWDIMRDQGICCVACFNFFFMFINFFVLFSTSFTDV